LAGSCIPAGGVTVVMPAELLFISRISPNAASHDRNSVMHAAYPRK
jgi:hypothetical protein